MPYRVLSSDEQKLEDWRQKDIPKVIKGIKAAEKLKLARRKYRHDHEFNMKMAEQNVQAYSNLNDLFMERIGRYYAFCRSKVQDPTISNKERRAWRKMALILQNEFTIGRLVEGNPYFRQTKQNRLNPTANPRSPPEAYKFCYVLPKIN